MTDVPTARRASARAQRPSGAGAAPADASGARSPRAPSPRAPSPGAVRRPPRPPEPPRGFERLVVPPDTGGPRVRLGFLWFFLALAAVTSGRWWTAGLAAAVAAAAGYQTARAWSSARASVAVDDGEVPVGTGRVGALISALLASTVPLAAGYGTGAAGAALVLVGVVAGSLMVTTTRPGGATVAIAAVLPAVAAASIVLALQVDLWAALFLVLTVSLYDAGNFALGAEATGRWEGPVGGVLGALAVTFTMSTIQVPPLDRAEWWVAGVVVAATCAAGQWVTSYVLPTPTTWVPALRRLDAYVVAGPLLLATMWWFGA